MTNAARTGRKITAWPGGRIKRVACDLVAASGHRALAIGIFVIDTVTPLEAAVAVLYVVVIMLASNFLPRRGVLLTSAICLVLTALSFLLTHELDDGTSLAR